MLFWAGRRLLAPSLVLMLVASGCAARKAYRQGQAEAQRGNWDTAVARLTVALEKDPGNIGYKLALENARIEAGRDHQDAARRHLAADDLERAAEELQIAANYDPGNQVAHDQLRSVREQLAERDAEARRLSEFGALRESVEAAPYPVPVLSPRDPKPIQLNFPDQSLEKVFEALSKLSGVNILFDDGYRDKRDSVVLRGVSFQQALDQLCMKNDLFYKVLDQNTLIIVPDTAAKRRDYDDQLVQTFFLDNADAEATLNVLKGLLQIQRAVANPELGSITLIGTPDQLYLASHVIARNDKALGEVVVEVEILEVNRNNLRRYGIELSNYEVGSTFSPTGAEGEVADGFSNVRAHLLSSLNLADFVVSIPSSVFARFLHTDSNVRILASPRLRASEGKQARLEIGTEVPVPVTTFTATQAGTSSFAPATSFQYRNVGVNLQITPKVMAGGEITLELDAEFSLLGDDRNVGTGNNPIIVPTFLTRQVTGTLRARDGETMLLGGLLQRREAESLRGALGLSRIPVLGKLFNSNQVTDDETEILISLTPRLVRGPVVTKRDLSPQYAGTGERLSVPEARPLFGRPLPTAGAEGPAAVPEIAIPDAVSAPEDQQQSDPPDLAASGPLAATHVQVRLSPDSLEAAPGASVSFPVVLVGASDLRAVAVSASYDPERLELVEAGPGPLLTLDGVAVGAETSHESGRVRARFARQQPFSGSGVVVRLEFRALAAGTAVVMLDAVELEGASGSVSPPLPGPASVEVTE